ncbi:MAG TPA: hypothetical protein VM032_13485 [Vicinamibacterales bacterium]|nr:hypothetical protein [Vicinamibacterales bacterium]
MTSITKRIVVTAIASVAAFQWGTAGMGAQDRQFRETVQVQGSAHRGLGDYSLTFSGPVALPGISLGGGTYVFRNFSNHVIQVSSAAGIHYSLLPTLPTTRGRSTDHYAVVLGEPAAPGSPRRIMAIFKPGEVEGEAFVYPKR